MPVTGTGRTSRIIPLDRLSAAVRRHDRAHELYEYPTTRNLSYWWNFGSLAGIILVIMIVTGIVLAMYYTPNAMMAFELGRAHHARR